MSFSDNYDEKYKFANYVKPHSATSLLLQPEALFIMFWQNNKS